MSEPTLMAEPREVVGKKVKRLRKQGLVPGVVYGPTMEETTQVTVSEKEFSRFFARHGHATLFDLTADGATWPVFIREVQVDPVRRTPLHVDFFSPNMLKNIDASVPLHLENAPDGPGIFQTMLHEIVVRGLPSNIPNRVVVDCSSLEEIGDAIRVEDIVDLPDVELLTSGDEMVAMLAAPVIEEEPEEVLEGVELDEDGEPIEVEGDETEEGGEEDGEEE